MRALPRAGVRSVIVALPDWLPADPATRVRELARGRRCVVYGAATARVLEGEGLANVVALPLALAAPLGAARPTGDEIVVYFNVGTGGPVDRRQVRLVLDTFRALLPRHPALHLLVKLHPDARGSLGAIESFHARMRVIDREVSNEQMRALLAEVDVTLFPSRFEGVGYPVLESLHAGVPVIATDAPPMNEIVEDERNGLLVRARDAGRYGAQTIRDVEPEDLRAQIERCATDRALLDRLKAGAHGGPRRGRRGVPPRVAGVGAALVGSGKRPRSPTDSVRRFEQRAHVLLVQRVRDDPVVQGRRVRLSLSRARAPRAPRRLGEIGGDRRRRDPPRAARSARARANMRLAQPRAAGLVVEREHHGNAVRAREPAIRSSARSTAAAPAMWRTCGGSSARSASRTSSIIGSPNSRRALMSPCGRKRLRKPSARQSRFTRISRKSAEVGALEAPRVARRADEVGEARVVLVREHDHRVGRAARAPSPRTARPAGGCCSRARRGW